MQRSAPHVHLYSLNVSICALLITVWKLRGLSLLTGEGAEQLDPAEAARIFEGQLASALLAEDGQLALSNLAASTVSTLMPKVCSAAYTLHLRVLPLECVAILTAAAHPSCPTES